jgi:branched-chain amino acid aminotransferase
MYQDGKCDDGALISDDKIVMSEDAGVLQYSQSVFEGLKAYETEDGHIVCFRPDLNAQRMYDSALRLEMPPFPVDRFIEAVKATVKANEAWVPPYGTGATLYIRPYMFGISPVIGVKPADDYMFRIFTTPVGPYFKGGAKPIVVRVSDYDRAAPRGTGHIKAGLNYAMSLHAIVDAHKEGFAENIYLDPATRTKLEETGGANILLVDQDNTLVIPASESILPSVVPPNTRILLIISSLRGISSFGNEIPVNYLSRGISYKYGREHVDLCVSELFQRANVFLRALTADIYDITAGAFGLDIFKKYIAGLLKIIMPSFAGRII